MSLNESFKSDLVECKLDVPQPRSTADPGGQWTVDSWCAFISHRSNQYLQQETLSALILCPLSPFAYSFFFCEEPFPDASKQIFNTQDMFVCYVVDPLISCLGTFLLLLWLMMTSYRFTGAIIFIWWTFIKIQHLFILIGLPKRNVNAKFVVKVRPKDEDCKPVIFWCMEYEKYLLNYPTV